MFGRKSKAESFDSSEGRKSSRGRRAALGGSVLVLAAVGGTGYYLGNEHGYTSGQEDCGTDFGPNSLEPISRAHSLTAPQIAAMKILAKSDAKAVGFHTTEEDLTDMGIKPILDDLSHSDARVVRVMLPGGLENAVNIDAAVRDDASTVTNILQNWAKQPDQVIKFAPEITSMQADADAQVLVEVDRFSC